MSEILKAVILGIVEGLTEWLPISSTGHMILVDEFLKLNVSDAFRQLFLVVIQLGAILAVVVLFWKKIWPFSIRQGRLRSDRNILRLWLKILVACVPAGVVGLLFDKQMNALFYNYQTVAIMLILFGLLFLWVEDRNKNRTPRIKNTSAISYRMAMIIGVFQMIAAVFPGTSRSGATIIGGLMLGISRTVAAEFTFVLAIPAMFGASLLKLVQFGFSFSGMELAILLTGMAVAFAVSMVSIRFLMGYIRKHSFKVFGWYRIVLGIVVLCYFWLLK